MSLPTKIKKAIEDAVFEDLTYRDIRDEDDLYFDFSKPDDEIQYSISYVKKLSTSKMLAYRVLEYRINTNNKMDKVTDLKEHAVFVYLDFEFKEGKAIK